MEGLERSDTSAAAPFAVRAARQTRLWRKAVCGGPGLRQPSTDVLYLRVSLPPSLILNLPFPHPEPPRMEDDWYNEDVDDQVGVELDRDRTRACSTWMWAGHGSRRHRRR